MPTAFVDTPFFIARINPRDQRHQLAGDAFRALPADTALKTSMTVLIDVLEFFSGHGTAHKAAITVVERVLRHADVEGTRIDIIDLNRRDILDAFVLYQSESATLSFTECLTIVHCKKGHVEGVLSHNQHFADQGLIILF